MPKFEVKYSEITSKGYIHTVEADTLEEAYEVANKFITDGYREVFDPIEYYNMLRNPPEDDYWVTMDDIDEIEDEDFINISLSNRGEFNISVTEENSDVGERRKN